MRELTNLKPINQTNSTSHLRHVQSTGGIPIETIFLPWKKGVRSEEPIRETDLFYYISTTCINCGSKVVYTLLYPLANVITLWWFVPVFPNNHTEHSRVSTPHWTTKQLKQFRNPVSGLPESMSLQPDLHCEVSWYPNTLTCIHGSGGGREASKTVINAQAINIKI